MMKMGTIAVIVLLLLVQSCEPVYAQQWDLEHRGQSVSEDVIAVGPGQKAIYDFTDTTASPILHILCRVASLHLDPNGTVTGVWRGPCSTAEASTSYCERLDADQDGDGVPDANDLNGDCSANRCSIYGVAPGAYYFDPTASDGSPARAWAQCPEMRD